MVHTPHGLATWSALILFGASIAACSSPTPTPTREQSRATASPHGAALWGDLEPVASVKELMKYMIDPVADNIFNAVGTTVTKQGTIDIEPKTEDDSPLPGDRDRKSTR